MNEVTKIHLGRQAFTISVDAHHELRKYLNDIKQQGVDKEVVDEVEVRMAELLTEHGINGNKVILPSDVDLLKEDDGQETISENLSGDTKRLFRDTENAMLAGVASGLAAYFGIDVLLVRILFVVGTVAWGGGLLVYILLWLLVPEAKTPSDRLQMVGKRVTVESLKEIVERADVKGAAHRANKSVAGPINSIFNILVKLFGISLTLLGLSFIASLLAGSIYLLAHGNIIQDNIFPIGLKEHLVVYLAVSVATLLSIFIILFGMAVFRRKWPIHLWLTGVLLGITLMGIVGGGALVADTAPRVRDRYNSHYKTIVKSVQPFTQINEVGPAAVWTQVSDRYYVAIKYYDQSDPSKVNVTVKGGILLVDASQYQWDRHCSSLCLPNHNDLEVTVYSPNPPQFSIPFLLLLMLQPFL
jgi:phage shock protein PspC (stress-responsive transcriptional regulator)